MGRQAHFVRFVKARKTNTGLSCTRICSSVVQDKVSYTKNISTFAELMDLSKEEPSPVVPSENSDTKDNLIFTKVMGVLMGDPSFLSYVRSENSFTKINATLTILMDLLEKEKSEMEASEKSDNTNEVETISLVKSGDTQGKEVNYSKLAAFSGQSHSVVQEHADKEKTVGESAVVGTTSRVANSQFVHNTNELVNVAAHTKPEPLQSSTRKSVSSVNNTESETELTESELDLAIQALTELKRELELTEEPSSLDIESSDADLESQDAAQCLPTQTSPQENVTTDSASHLTQMNGIVTNLSRDAQPKNQTPRMGDNFMSKFVEHVTPRVEPVTSTLATSGARDLSFWYWEEQRLNQFIASTQSMDNRPNETDSGSSSLENLPSLTSKQALVERSYETKRCSVCDEELTGKGLSDVWHHMYKKHKVARFICPTCGKGFPVMCYLRYHMYTHEGKRLYSCIICEKEYFTASSLYMHNRREHNMEAPRSSVVHSKERGFQCDVCQKTFTLKNRLYPHILSHDKTLVPCKKCGKMFKISNIKVHVRRCITGFQKRFQCETCGAQLSSSQAFKLHVKMHSGDKESFVCEICGNKFTRKYNLQGHLKLHAGIYKLTCDTCGRKFAQMWNLRQHVKSCRKRGSEAGT